MAKRRIIFRADASKNTGYGHFIRSLALAGYLKDDFECLFASYNDDWHGCAISDYQYDEITKICNPAEIVGFSLGDYNNEFLKELRPDDIVVLDNYYYDTQYQQSIKDKGCKLVCVDDMHQFHMVCDLLLTACPLKREDFFTEPYTKFAGGIEWAFLREPFLTPVKYRNIPTQISRIVMAMGGADAFSLTDKMIDVVLKVMPDIGIDVICGDTATVTKENDRNVTIHRRISAEEIVRLFEAADLGIFPASTICIEAFSRKLPVIAGYYVDNQKEFYDYGVSHKYFSGLGNLLDDKFWIEKRLRNTIDRNRPKPMVVDFSKQKEKIIELFKAL